MGPVLHMGLGDQSTARCYQLIQTLMKAFDDLSAFQQLTGLVGFENESDELRQKIDRAASEIYLSLTGYKPNKRLP